MDSPLTNIERRIANSEESAPDLAQLARREEPAQARAPLSCTSVEGEQARAALSQLEARFVDSAHQPSDEGAQVWFVADDCDNVFGAMLVEPLRELRELCLRREDVGLLVDLDSELVGDDLCRLAGTHQ